MSAATVCAFVSAMSLLGAASAAMPMKMSTQLSGSEQVPAVQTPGTGQFQGTIATDNKSIAYRLTFSGLSSRVTVAHIHVGARGTNGPVVVFFCGGGGGRPSCPAPGGTVTGTITAASVVAGGNIKRGDLPGLIKAIMTGDTYVNVHTTKYKDGEIRGPIAIGM
jgi:hypothetical protein